MEVGERLRSRLRALASTSPRIGEIRGRGLITGVDLRPPPGQAARGYARTMLDQLARHQVLAGATGPDGTVLKVRPPLIWQPEHVDQFIDTLATLVGTDDA